MGGWIEINEVNRPSYELVAQKVAIVFFIIYTANLMVANQNYSLEATKVQ